MPSSSTNDSPENLLSASLANGRIDVLKSLLSELAKQNDYNDILNSSCTESGTLLHHASKLGDIDAVRTLLRSGASPCVRNAEGLTPLQIPGTEPKIRHAFEQHFFQSVAESNLGRTCQLMTCGIPTTILDTPTTKNTPLHWAASYGSVDIVKVLCEGGSPVNAVNFQHESALHDAVRRGDVAVVSTLLDYGADPKVESAEGLDCLALAEQKGKHPAVIQLLNARAAEAALGGHKHRERTPSLSSVASSVTAGNGSSDMRRYASCMQSNAFSQDLELPAPTWKDSLWPPPRKLFLAAGADRFFVHDRKLNFFISHDVDVNRKRLLDLLDVTMSGLIKRDFSIIIVSPESLSQLGNDRIVKVTMFPAAGVVAKVGAYNLQITENLVNLVAWTWEGLACAFATFARLVTSSTEDGSNAIPCLSLRDQTPTAYRCLSIDARRDSCSNVDTIVRHIVGQAANLHANVVMLHFGQLNTVPSSTHSILPVQSHCDTRYEAKIATGMLPFTTEEFEKLNQVCATLQISLVPSFDVNLTKVDAVVENDFSRSGELTPTTDSVFDYNCDNLNIKGDINNIENAINSLNGNHDGMGKKTTASYMTVLRNIDRNMSDSVLSTISSILHYFPNAPFYQIGPKLLDYFLAGPPGLLEAARGRVPLILCPMSARYLLIGHSTAETFKPGLDRFRILFHGQILPGFCIPILECNSCRETSRNLMSHWGQGNNFSNRLESLLTPFGLSFDLHDDPREQGSSITVPMQRIAQSLVIGRNLLNHEPLIMIVGDCAFAGHGNKQPKGRSLALSTLGSSANAALLGLAWNPGAFVDISHMLERLSRFTAVTCYAETKMTNLFHILSRVANIEQHLENLLYFPSSEPSSNNSEPARAASVLGQLLRMPDDVSLERASPVMFKKAKIELTKCSQALVAMKTKIPYDFELAVTLVEAQVVTELLVVAAKLGLALCVMGTKPGTNGNQHSGPPEIVNVGVSNLTLTTRTDIANRILSLRTTFQHAWLSRHQPRTLPSAQLLFDQILEKLLPLSMREGAERGSLVGDEDEINGD